MGDQPSAYHHLRCEHLGPVVVAVASRAAFDASRPEDDSTNPEWMADLVRLAATSCGPVVLDIREVRCFLGDAAGKLLRFSRIMADAGKPLAVCASPLLLKLFAIARIDRQILCVSEPAEASERFGVA